MIRVCSVYLFLGSARFLARGDDVMRSADAADPNRATFGKSQRVRIRTPNFN